MFLLNAFSQNIFCSSTSSSSSNNSPSPPPSKTPISSSVAAASSEYQNLYDSTYNHLNIGRYVFLVVILLQFLALLVTIVMKVRYPYADDFEDYNSEASTAQSAMAQIQLENLKHSVSKSKSSTDANTSYYATSQKMYRK